MGQTISYLSGYVYDSIFGKMTARIIMIGLDAAGKTSILLKLRIGKVISTTIPTVGFNVVTVGYNNLNFTVWDVGGQDRLRPLWRRYCENADAIIFVVDSADNERICVARDELHNVLAEDSLRDTKVLVFANKQDMPNAMTVSDLTNGLELHKASCTQEWYVQGCSVINGGEGLYEGLEWLAFVLKRPKK